MKKREPPQIGDLVCLTYNHDTIGIVTEISNLPVSTFRYKVFPLCSCMRYSKFESTTCAAVMTKYSS
jgi:hypothetical protein